MSTILDALRKAKQAPTQDSVDADSEVINGTSHDYLATVPDSPDAQLRNLRTIVVVAGCIIAFLFILVIVLLSITLRKLNETPASSTISAQSISQAADPADNATEVDEVAPAVATPAPVATPIVVYVAMPTPVPAPPTPVLTPTPAATAAPEFPVQSVAEALEFRGILWDETAPMAMINGKSVQEGAVVSGYTIKNIQKDCIIVISPNGDESTLKP